MGSELIVLLPKTGPSNVKKPKAALSPALSPSKCLDELLCGDINANITISKSNTSGSSSGNSKTADDSSNNDNPDDNNSGSSGSSGSSKKTRQPLPPVHHQSGTYLEVPSFQQLQTNVQTICANMPLLTHVLPLRYTLTHVLNLMRLWRSTKGSLLVGESGSGKTTVVAVAAAVCGHQVVRGSTRNKQLFQHSWSQAVYMACAFYGDPSSDNSDSSNDGNNASTSNGHSNEIVYVVHNSISEQSCAPAASPTSSTSSTSSAMNPEEVWSTIKIHSSNPLRTFANAIDATQRMELLDQTRAWITLHVGSKQEQTMTDRTVVEQYILPRLVQRLHVVVLCEGAR